MVFTEVTFLIAVQRGEKHLIMKAILKFQDWESPKLMFPTRIEPLLWGKGHSDSEQRKIWKTDGWSLEAVVSPIFRLTETSR